MSGGGGGAVGVMVVLILPREILARYGAISSAAFALVLSPKNQGRAAVAGCYQVRVKRDVPGRVARSSGGTGVFFMAHPDHDARCAAGAGCVRAATKRL